MTRPIRIGFIIDRIFHIGGGTEMYLSRLVRGLDQSRFECRIAVLRPCDWEIDPGFFPCPLEVLDCGPVFSPTLLRDRNRLSNWLSTNEIDIAQTLFPDAHLLGLPAARAAEIHIRIRSRRNLGLARSLLRIHLERFAGRSATHFLANSQAAANSLVELDHVDPQKILIVTNGADTSRFPERTEGSVREAKRALGFSPDDLLITLVSNHRLIKDVRSFFESARSVLKQEPKARFILLGHGNVKPWRDLHRWIDEWGISDRCELPGRVIDVMPYLAATDVAVLTSISEGFSNALLEYQGCGIPTIATNVGGNPEIVVDGETGFLIPTKSPEILAERILHMLSDHELAHRVGVAARNRVFKRFSLERELREHELLYGALASQSGIEIDPMFRMKQIETPPLGERIAEWT